MTKQRLDGFMRDNLEPRFQASEENPQAMDTAAGRPCPGLPKVLVVDDEPELVDLAAALLHVHGFEVVTAAGAVDALRMLAQDQRIGAMFSDVTMPGMTGLELADAVAKVYPHVRIVLASGYMAAPLGPGPGRRYLFTPKPYLIETVVALLRGADGR